MVKPNVKIIVKFLMELEELEHFKKELTENITDKKLTEACISL